jgi:hypothetical protein
VTKKQALRRAAQGTAKAIAASETRNAAILAALEFCSVREVAAATGLSPARIHQIRHGR